MIIILAAVGMYVYWVVQAQDVLEIKNAPVTVRMIKDTPQVKGVVVLHVDYCKKVDADGQVRISFVSDSTEVFLPVSTDRGEPVCREADVPILIPENITPDTYHVHFRVEYQVNPIKDVIEEFDSQPFEIVE